MPGIGCGVFAGPFRNMFQRFYESVCLLLRKHAQQLRNIAGVYFMEYEHMSSSHIAEYKCEEISIIRWKNGPSLLAENKVIAPELGDCHIAKFVAWDHFSWPGNDFFANSRHTDDGVSAAATNVMEKLLPNNGQYHYEYNAMVKMFLASQKGEHLNWEQVMPQHRLIPDQSLCLP